MSSSEWRYYKIENILSKVIDNRGKNPPFSISGYPYIDTTCIVGENRYPDYSLVRKYISKDTYSNWFRSGHPKKDDLLIATVGANIGKICLMDDTEACIAQNTVGLRINNEIAHPVFVYYILNSYVIQSYLKSLDVGSAQPSIKVPHLLNVELSLPPLPIQRRIADILSALDEKIELNRQMNETLVSMAQAIFREWFVVLNYDLIDGMRTMIEDGATLPSGWQVGRVGDILNLSNEIISPANTPEKEFFHYSIPAFDSGHTPVKELGASILSNKFIVRSNSILVSKLNPRIPRIWAIGKVDEKTSICSTEFQVLVPKEPFFYAFAFNLLTQPSFIEIMKSRASGTSSSHQRIKPQDILDIQIIIPDNETLNLYQDAIGNFYSHFNNALEQTATLASIRDALLPKLMSGEIEVNEINH